MDSYDIAIIGAGPAGLAAAISSAQSKKKIILLEKQSSIGKKILVSGAGRCNLLNEHLSEVHYNIAARKLVKSIFAKFGKKDIAAFFENLGLKMYIDDGRFFPVTNQSASVLKILEIELRRLKAPIELNFETTDILQTNDEFTVTAKDGRTLTARKLIVACGGKSYPALSSIKSLYSIAEQFSHTIIEPVPSAVPLVVKDQLCHILQGQKIFADAKAIIEGKTASEASGELLFTKYGLSGTAILDISEEISLAINRHHKKDVIAVLDMIPFMESETLKDELKKRIKADFLTEDLIAGILPNKFSKAFRGLLESRNVETIAAALKNIHFKVIGTRGWNEAEFTCGGIKSSEVNESLESKFKKNLYFAGEILDVTGRRGGYNLAWAWASGFVSGLTD